MLQSANKLEKVSVRFGRFKRSGLSAARYDGPRVRRSLSPKRLLKQPLNPSKSKRPSLGKPLVARIGKRVVVKLTPNRSGRLQVTVFSRKKRIRVCTFRKAVAMRPVLCYVNRAGKPGSLRNVRVVAVQKQVRGKPRFVRAVVTKRRI